MRRWRQPDLTDDWGCPFYGRAETITGHVWWYTDDDDVRHLLRPAVVKTMPEEGVDFVDEDEAA